MARCKIAVGDPKRCEATFGGEWRTCRGGIAATATNAATAIATAATGVAVIRIYGYLWWHGRRAHSPHVASTARASGPTQKKGALSGKKCAHYSHPCASHALTYVNVCY